MDEDIQLFVHIVFEYFLSCCCFDGVIRFKGEEEEEEENEEKGSQRGDEGVVRKWRAPR